MILSFIAGILIGALMGIILQWLLEPDTKKKGGVTDGKKTSI